MYDLFFVSYAEPNADENWELLVERFPHAKRIHGISGIDNAHKACANKSNTRMFWTVDGDTVVDDEWAFDHDVSKWDRDYIHIWYSRNPINGLAYGYGAVKLWPKAAVMAHQGRWTDFTTSFSGLKIIPHIIAETRFNSSPFEAWKSAFRECVKLSERLRHNPIDGEARERLLAWNTMFDESQPFYQYAKLGALAGVEWHAASNDISLINDFSRLRALFDSALDQQF